MLGKEMPDRRFTFDDSKPLIVEGGNELFD
jgi:hypothetical protein